MPFNRKGIEQNVPETVSQRDRGAVISSGGGFSDHYPMPAWQKSAVAGYFDLVADTDRAPYPGYNTTGRAYPDISAAASHIAAVNGGEMNPNYGTSASCPIVAAMISLVNAARLRGGGKSVGFINPILYSEAASSFTKDVTVGKTNCAAGWGPCCLQGYSAAEGWDPASGQGTLDFRSFRRYMLSIVNIATPTSSPTQSPTRRRRSKAPSVVPTATPTPSPSSSRSVSPSVVPTATPTPSPSSSRSVSPSVVPTATPTPSSSSSRSVSPLKIPITALTESLNTNLRLPTRRPRKSLRPTHSLTM